ncbi:MAG: ZPR1 zinc finger domain-containing protein [Asgard group archaeon]|nr:ZPR1 zinc finger domain-containing protein [Asgard group archaeon]
MTTEDFNFETLTAPCPVCRSDNTKVTQKIVNLPHFPQLWLFNLLCNDCNYKHNDFLNLSVKEPIKYIYHAENKDDYTTKIVRAANGTLRFPQIGAIIEPGPSANGFISNIEGILRDIQQKAQHLLRDATKKEEIKRIGNYIKLLDEYIEQNHPIDIVVEDPFGNSSIIPFDPDKLETIQLTKEEAEKLKTGFMVFEDVKQKEDD